MSQRFLMFCEDCDPPLCVVRSTSARDEARDCGFREVTGVTRYEAMWQKQENKMPAKRERVKADEPIEHSQDLATKHRPRTMRDVVGQDATVAALTKALGKSTRPHVFIFSGPSGTGKTTLARIVGYDLGVSPHNIVDVDAATNTGVDAMRDILAGTIYQGFGGSTKLYVIDEAHMLSKAAWNSMLKTLEEPPEHVYFAICTTEPTKIPATVVTRAGGAYALKSVRPDDLFDLLERVCKREMLGPDEKVLDAISRAAGGSPRMALHMLSKVADVEDLETVHEILEGTAEEESKEIIDLCRLLLERRLSWERLTTTLRGLEGQTAEGIRIVVVNYVAACLMKAKGDSAAKHLLDVLACFSPREPYNPTDKMAPLLLAFGRLLYN